MKERQTQPKPAEENPLWKKTPYANLIRYLPSGMYFARIRVGGKLIRQSLKTKSITVAKLKLADLDKGERTKIERVERLREGSALVSDLIKEYQARLEANHTIKPRTRQYYTERLAALVGSWPQLEATDARQLTEEQCRDWAARYVKAASPTNYNNTVAILRAVLEIAVEQGVRYTNPASALKRARIVPKQLTLPSQDQFLALLDEIRRVPFGPGLASAEFVEFLAYGGFRKSEAANIRWVDCDFDKREILVRGDHQTGTKNWEVRRVPMIPDMQQLLRRMRDARAEEPADHRVVRVRECQGTIDRACRQLGLARFTHHDLRHLFATRCIEAGVDVPTVSRWLGHKDGGALAMKVYGHLREQHSVSMAQKVTFGSVRPKNIVSLPATETDRSNSNDVPAEPEVAGRMN